MSLTPEFDPDVLDAVELVELVELGTTYEPDPELDEAHANYQIASEFVLEIQQLIEHSSAI